MRFDVGRLERMAQWPVTTRVCPGGLLPRPVAGLDAVHQAGPYTGTPFGTIRLVVLPNGIPADLDGRTPRIECVGRIADFLFRAHSFRVAQSPRRSRPGRTEICLSAELPAERIEPDGAHRRDATRRLRALYTAKSTGCIRLPKMQARSGTTSQPSLLPRQKRTTDASGESEWLTKKQHDTARRCTS